jgi:hypothetical protein
LVAPFGGVTAAKFAASPEAAEPEGEIAIFVPELFWQAIPFKILNHII